jgi:hypothetical protein
MTHYFVDNRTQPDGAHEVHSVGCKRMASDKQYLGDFLSCEQAVFEARQVYWHADRELSRFRTEAHRHTRREPRVRSWY